MPLFYQHNINQTTRLAVWQIDEPEDFFIEKVPLSRSITHPHKRLQHLAGRYLLQYLFPDFPIHLIQIADTRKPYLADESHHFSISHCGKYAAVIVSTSRRVGIDIELHTERINLVRHKFLSKEESELDNPCGELFPTLIWSVKEAMFKWYSLGEMDFRRHFAILAITASSSGIGRVDAVLRKGEPVKMQLPFVYWDDLVLTWVWM
jgi:4'-phosphopantetheinyl transferase EntD